MKSPPGFSQWWWCRFSLRLIGVRNYVKRFKPSLVICENVEGLTWHNKGNPPQINDVMKDPTG